MQFSINCLLSVYCVLLLSLSVSFCLFLKHYLLPCYDLPKKNANSCDFSSGHEIYFRSIYLNSYAILGSAPVTSGPPHGQPLPPDYGPPPYEATMQPGFVPPHVPGEGPMPMPHLHGKRAIDVVHAYNA